MNSSGEVIRGLRLEDSSLTQFQRVSGKTKFPVPAKLMHFPRTTHGVGWLIGTAPNSMRG